MIAQANDPEPFTKKKTPKKKKTARKTAQVIASKPAPYTLENTPPVSEDEMEVEVVPNEDLDEIESRDRADYDFSGVEQAELDELKDSVDLGEEDSEGSDSEDRARTPDEDYNPAEVSA